jgi:hypothetical protein
LNTTPCALDGITLAHSSSSLFYKERSVAFGTTCASVSANRTCTNGKLSASDDFKYGSCSVSPSASSGSINANLASALTALEAALKAILEKLGQ